MSHELVSLGTLVAVLRRRSVGAEPCSSHPLLVAEALHLVELLLGGRSRRLVQILGEVDAVGTAVGSEVVAAAASVLAGDSLDDIDWSDACHSRLPQSVTEVESEHKLYPAEDGLR